jgi:hypothetical protein
MAQKAMKKKMGSPERLGSVGEAGGKSGVGLPEQRMWDLVRYMRGKLHTDGLITDEEFALLVVDHPAVARLEAYDMLRVENKRLRAEFAEVAAQSERFRQGLVAAQEENLRLRDALELVERFIDPDQSPPQWPRAKVLEIVRARLWRGVAELAKSRRTREDSHHGTE